MALQPGVVDGLGDLEADLLHDLGFHLIAPGDAPGATVLGRVGGSGGAGAGLIAVDGVLLHGGPGLSLV